VKPMVTPGVGYVAGNRENCSQRDDRHEAITKPVAGSEIHPCHDVNPVPKPRLTPRGDPSYVPVLGPKLRHLNADCSARSQETNTAPDSVVTPTSRSSRLGRRGCERVKSTRRHPSPVAVLCSATTPIIDGASGLFMAKRRRPSALCNPVRKGRPASPRLRATSEAP
jgi:hypothetical protein